MAKSELRKEPDTGLARPDRSVSQYLHPIVQGTNAKYCRSRPKCAHFSALYIVLMGCESKNAIDINDLTDLTILVDMQFVNNMDHFPKLGVAPFL